MKRNHGNTIDEYRNDELAKHVRSLLFNRMRTEQIIKEIDEGKKNRYNPFKYDYKGHLKLWLEEVRPGMYDEVQQKYNKRRPSPKPDKETTESKKKKAPSKKSTTKAKVSNLLSGLTDEEKAELLKQLKG